jgi:hypothetical protein
MENSSLCHKSTESMDNTRPAQPSHFQVDKMTDEINETPDVETPAPEATEQKEPVAETPEMPPIRDQETILVLKTCGYQPINRKVIEVERHGEKKREVLIYFPPEAYEDWLAWGLDNDNHRPEFKILREFFASQRWWRSIIHNKHLV